MTDRRHRRRTPEQALGLAICELRKERGVTPIELAWKADLSERTLNAVEKGQRVAQWGTLRRIAHALNVPLWRLLTEAEKRE